MKNRKFSLVVAIAILAGAASAFTTIKKPDANVKYNVTGTDGSYYILGTNITGEVQGVDYDCTSSTQKCTAEAPSTDVVSRNGQTEVPMADASVIQGTFQQL